MLNKNGESRNPCLASKLQVKVSNLFFLFPSSSLYFIYFLHFILKNFSGFGVLLECRQNHVSLAISEKVYVSVTDNFFQ